MSNDRSSSDTGGPIWLCGGVAVRRVAVGRVGSGCAESGCARTSVAVRRRRASMKRQKTGMLSMLSGSE